MMILDSYRFGGGGGGNTPIPASATGVAVGSREYFIDVDGFDNLTGSGDYTFIAWYNAASVNEMVFWWQGDFNGAVDRFEITSDSVISGTTRYGDNTTAITTLPAAVVVVKTSGTTDVYHYREGVRTDFTGLSVPNPSVPSSKCIGNSLNINTSPSGDIIAMQYWDSAQTIGDINSLLTNYELSTDATETLSFFQNTSGSSDNGAYSAIMSATSTPSPYSVTGSFEAEPSWRAFESNWTQKTITRASGGSGSAGSFITVDMGSSSSQAVDEYLFRSWPNQGLNSFTISGSNDDSTYTSLYTGTGLNNDDDIQKHTWTNATAYRYYRIICNSGFNGTQWTHYESILIDRSKAWQSGAGYAKDGTMTFPT
jgi:hypothetical protein